MLALSFENGAKQMFVETGSILQNIERTQLLNEGREKDNVNFYVEFNIDTFLFHHAFFFLTFPHCHLSCTYSLSPN